MNLPQLSAGLFTVKLQYWLLQCCKHARHTDVNLWMIVSWFQVYLNGRQQCFCFTVLFPMGRDQFNKYSLVHFCQMIQSVFCVSTKTRFSFYRFDPTSPIWKQKYLIQAFCFGFRTIAIFQPGWMWNADLFGSKLTKTRGVYELWLAWSRSNLVKLKVPKVPVFITLLPLLVSSSPGIKTCNIKRRRL